MSQVQTFITKYHTYILIALAAVGTFVAYAFGITPPEWLYSALAALGLTSVRISVAQSTGVTGWKTYALAAAEAAIAGMRAAGMEVPPAIDEGIIVLAGGTVVSAVKQSS